MKKKIHIKRAESRERQKKHDALTTSQKLRKAQSRRGSSKKEIERYEVDIKKEIERDMSEQSDIFTPATTSEMEEIFNK